jgi:hypothetical protein
MQDVGFGLLRIPLPGTSVNKGRKKGRSLRVPGSGPSYSIKLPLLLRFEQREEPLLSRRHCCRLHHWRHRDGSPGKANGKSRCPSR